MGMEGRVEDMELRSAAQVFEVLKGVITEYSTGNQIVLQRNGGEIDLQLHLAEDVEVIFVYVRDSSSAEGDEVSEEVYVLDPSGVHSLKKDGEGQLVDGNKKERMAIELGELIMGVK